MVMVVSATTADHPRYIGAAGFLFSGRGKPMRELQTGGNWK
jgi:hypothetical protein